MKGNLLEGREEEEEGFGEDFFVGVLDVDVFFSLHRIGQREGGMALGWLVGRGVGMMTDHD